MHDASTQKSISNHISKMSLSFLLNTMAECYIDGRFVWARIVGVDNCTRHVVVDIGRGRPLRTISVVRLSNMLAGDRRPITADLCAFEQEAENISMQKRRRIHVENITNELVRCGLK